MPRNPRHPRLFINELSASRDATALRWKAYRPPFRAGPVGQFPCRGEAAPPKCQDFSCREFSLAVPDARHPARAGPRPAAADAADADDPPAAVEGQPT
jgi:hypothetical protein